MKFEPFLAPLCFARPGEEIVFDRPVQPTLFPEFQALAAFGLRLHQAFYLHFDFRFRILNTLLSFVLYQAPSYDPDKSVKAKLSADHDSKHLLREYVVPAGPGAGPAMPVDWGNFVPIGSEFETIDQEVLRQLKLGVFCFTLYGEHLKGGWELRRVHDDIWELRKLRDQYASKTNQPQLNRSVISGKALDKVVSANPNRTRAVVGQQKSGTSRRRRHSHRQ